MEVLGFEEVLTATVLLAVAHLSLKTRIYSKGIRYFYEFYELDKKKKKKTSIDEE